MAGNIKVDKVIEEIIKLPYDQKHRKNNIEESQKFQDKWELVIKYNGNIEKLCTQYGAYINRLTDGYAILNIEEEKIIPFSQNEEVLYIEKPSRIFKIDKNIFHYLKDSIIRENSMIGIIDSDIDYFNSRFINSDGTTKIISLWDQTMEEKNSHQGMETKYEMTNEKINNMLKQLNKLDFLEKYCDSNQSTNKYILVNLRSKGEDGVISTTQYLEALKYLMDKAKEHNRPIIIYTSYEIDGGEDSRRILFNEIIRYINNHSNIDVVIPQINSFMPHHIKEKLQEKDISEIELEIGNGERVVTLEIWKNYFDDIDIELISPKGNSTGIIKNIQEFSKTIIGDIECYIYKRGPFEISKDEQVDLLIIPEKETVDKGTWTLKLYPNRIVDGSFEILLSTKQRVHKNTKLYKKKDIKTIEVMKPKPQNNNFKLIGALGYRYTPNYYSYRGNKRITIYTTKYHPRVMNPVFLAYMPSIYNRYR